MSLQVHDTPQEGRFNYARAYGCLLGEIDWLIARLTAGTMQPKEAAKHLRKAAEEAEARGRERL